MMQETSTLDGLGRKDTFFFMCLFVIRKRVVCSTSSQAVSPAEPGRFFLSLNEIPCCGPRACQANGEFGRLSKNLYVRGNSRRENQRAQYCSERMGYPADGIGGHSVALGRGVFPPIESAGTLGQMGTGFTLGKPAGTMLNGGEAMGKRDSRRRNRRAHYSGITGGEDRVGDEEARGSDENVAEMHG